MKVSDVRQSEQVIGGDGILVGAERLYYIENIRNGGQTLAEFPQRYRILRDVEHFAELLLG